MIVTHVAMNLTGELVGSSCSTCAGLRCVPCLGKRRAAFYLVFPAKAWSFESNLRHVWNTYNSATLRLAPSTPPVLVRLSCTVNRRYCHLGRTSFEVAHTDIAASIFSAVLFVRSHGGSGNGSGSAAWHGGGSGVVLLDSRSGPIALHKTK